jgi:hypothetical protein
MHPRGTARRAVAVPLFFTHFELYAYDQTTAYSNDAVEVSVDPLPAHA